VNYNFGLITYLKEEPNKKFSFSLNLIPKLSYLLILTPTSIEKPFFAIIFLIEEAMLIWGLICFVKDRSKWSQANFFFSRMSLHSENKELLLEDHVKVAIRVEERELIWKDGWFCNFAKNAQV
jgi:hypothetical protein